MFAIAIFQEEFNQFIIKIWRKLKNSKQEKLCERLINKFTDENSRVQELLLLYARNNGPRDGAIKVYTDLLLKLKDSVVHHPSVFDIVK